MDSSQLTKPGIEGSRGKQDYGTRLKARRRNTVEGGTGEVSKARPWPGGISVLPLITWEPLEGQAGVGIGQGCLVMAAAQAWRMLPFLV